MARVFVYGGYGHTQIQISFNTPAACLPWRARFRFIPWGRDSAPHARYPGRVSDRKVFQ